MRRLLAFLALLSGLAAVGTPVGAAVSNGVCEQVASAEVSQPGKQVQCACDTKRRGPASGAGSERGAKTRKPVKIFIPTVQFGADRAHE